MLVRWNRGADDDAGIQMDEKKKLKKKYSSFILCKTKEKCQAISCEYDFSEWAMEGKNK